MGLSEQTIKHYMRQNIKEHVDLDTEEVDITGLAEDGAEHFDVWGPPPDFTVPDVFFDCAFEVNDEYPVVCDGEEQDDQ